MDSLEKLRDERGRAMLDLAKAEFEIKMLKAVLYLGTAFLFCYVGYNIWRML